MGYPKEAEPRKAPHFSDEQEAGEFWDTHSPLDYPGEFKEVEVKFSRPLVKRGLTIKLNEETIERLT